MITKSSSTTTAKLKAVAGWYGVAAILFAYMLLSFKVIEASSLPYQLLNLTGAGGIIVEAAAKKDVQPVVLNIIWAIIATVGIIRLVLT